MLHRNMLVSNDKILRTITKFSHLLLILLTCILKISIFETRAYAQPSPLTNPNIEEFEVNNQPITEILKVFSDIYGVSILYDSTVDGRASYKFVNTDFNSALDSFLDQNNLFAEENPDGIYRISKLRIALETASATGTQDNAAQSSMTLISVSGKEVDVSFIIDSLAKRTDVTILYDRVPNISLSLYVNKLPLVSILEIIRVRLGDDYLLEESEGYFAFVNTKTAGGGGSRRARVSKNDQLYSVQAAKTTIKPLLKELFERGEREYISFIERDIAIEDIYLESKEFDQILSLILQSGGANFEIQDDGVYRVFQSENRALQFTNKQVRQFSIVHMPVEELVKAIPRDYIAQSQYSIDQDTNTLVYVGQTQEINAIASIIAVLDSPAESQSFRLDLSNISPQRAIPLIKKQFPETRLKEIDSTNSLLVSTDFDSYTKIVKFVGVIDSSQTAEIIRLNYVKASHIFENLPTSIAPNEVVATNDPSTILFTGNASRYNEVIKEIAVMDSPISQIRYQVLVLQYNESLDYSIGLGIANSLNTPSSSTAILGSLSRIFSLSFDVLSTFGMVFSANLDASLASGNSKVFIDTVLRSLSGEKVSFTSDNTYRYQEIEVGSSSSTITTSRGVTREITSGFAIDIEGWVSGDDYVTMNITTQLSKLGVSPTTNDLPPSSEKKLTTNVRTFAGEPVVIGGLYQDESDFNVGKKSLIGLGDTKNRVEYRVYVIPIIERIATTTKSIPSLRRIYEKFVLDP